MSNEVVVFSEDSIRIEKIQLPWNDVAMLMFQIGILAIPVGILVSVIVTASSMFLFGLLGMSP